MKPHAFFRSSPSLLIGILGILIPLTAVNAEEYRDRGWYEKVPPTEKQEATTPSGQSDENTTPAEPRGAEGPVRSDTSAAPSTEDEREKQLQQERDDQEKERRELELRAAPMGTTPPP